MNYKEKKSSESVKCKSCQNLDSEFKKLLRFLATNHPIVYEEYKSGLYFVKTGKSYNSQI